MMLTRIVAGSSYVWQALDMRWPIKSEDGVRDLSPYGGNPPPSACLCHLRRRDFYPDRINSGIRSPGFHATVVLTGQTDMLRTKFADSHTQMNRSAGQ